MVVLNRRAFMAVTAAGVVAPAVIGAKEVVAKGTDWMTMSLKERNLAFNNVAHVGPEFARKKTEGWAAASKALRAQRRSTSIWLMLKQIGPSGTCIPPLILKRPATFTFMAVIGNAAVRRYLLVWGYRERFWHQRKPTEVLAVNEQYALMITGFPLFHGFTLDGARMLLDCGEVKEYRTDEVLFKEGDSPTFVLLVLTGKMQVFVERQPRDLLLTDAGPGTILGELAVLCGIPRSASVRASEKSAILQWSAPAFRSLLRDTILSERIFRESLRTLIEKEQSLI